MEHGETAAFQAAETGAADMAPKDTAWHRRNAPDHTALKGSGQAIPADAIGNPFSLLHEKRRGEGRAEETPAPARKIGSADKAPQAAAPSMPLPVVRGAGAPALKGIVSGAQSRLAILSDGTQTATLAVGESFAGFVVESIEADGVSVRGEAGTAWLALPAF